MMHNGTCDCLSQVTGNQRLCENNPALRRLLQMRGPHIDPVRIDAAGSVAILERQFRSLIVPDGGRLTSRLQASLINV